jgi:uncharacterized surface protein with fasciclin (FAS1) repeats
MFLRSFAVVPAAAALLLVACGGEATNVPAQDATNAAAVSSTGGPDILATADAAGQFKTLTAAIKAAGLEETLKGAGPFTVFAPTDDAFKKLPAGTVESLLKPENKDKLKAILTYHVVSGKVPSTDAVKLTTAKTVNGKDIKLSVDGKDLKLNGSAKVVKADINASNGVIHVIDTVILPE